MYEKLEAVIDNDERSRQEKFAQGAAAIAYIGRSPSLNARNAAAHLRSRRGNGQSYGSLLVRIFDDTSLVLFHNILVHRGDGYAS